VSDIPYPTTPLLGRATEMAALHRLLEQDRVRLVTLTGPGGAGKTRLAVEFASELKDSFDRGWFVDLSAITTPDLVPAAVGEAIGIQDAGAAELDAIVREMLSVGRFLLLMDNFEHVLEAGSYVARLLSGSRNLVVLATSREALRIRSEHTFQVEPLAVPRRDQLDDLTALRQFPSVELFEDRARAVRPAFDLNDAVLPTVAEICLDLDGLPLAIELVASQAGVLAPHEMLERLSARAPLLTGGPRDVPTRHQTLDAAVAWSYDLLTSAEQKTFRLCGVFAGGFTIAAMNAIQGEDALNTVSQIVSKNLVRITSQAPRPSRYWLLDTIRGYAMDRLIEAGEVTAARREHARYYVDCAEQLQGSLRGPGMADALDSLASEYGNFRAVFHWSTSPDGELELGLRLAGALYRFWHARGYVTEARAWLESALERSDAVSPRVRALALNAAGVMAGMQHDHDRAIGYLQQSLALWEQLGEVDRQARVALNLGFVAQNLGDLEKAEQIFDQAQTLYARIRDLAGQANAVGSRARIAQERGDLRRASDLFVQCLRLFREVGDEWGVANALANWGYVKLGLDDKLGAQDAFRESLKLREELGNEVHIAESLEGLAAVMADDAPRLAVRLLGAAELMRQTSGAPVPAPEAERYGAIVARARSGLTLPLFKASWNAGRALSVKSAIEIGMGATGPADEPLPEFLAASRESSLDLLSAREREIAVLIGRGYSNRAIAQKLVVSVKTIETHVKHIFAKLDVRNRAGVAALVTRVQGA
jgi:predicted ATPase/DNA-binding CsgD family transcriptional regulator